MSNTLPQSETEIRAEFSDRANYFWFMVMVAEQRGTKNETATCAYARRVMLALGYPSETAAWDNSRVLRYAQNIVAMG